MDYHYGSVESRVSETVSTLDNISQHSCTTAYSSLLRSSCIHFEILHTRAGLKQDFFPVRLTSHSGGEAHVFMSLTGFYSQMASKSHKRVRGYSVYCIFSQIN